MPRATVSRERLGHAPRIDIAVGDHEVEDAVFGHVAQRESKPRRAGAIDLVALHATMAVPRNAVTPSRG